MAKQKGKSSGGTKNPERRNGKAWKKPKTPKVKSHERELKDFAIRMERERRKQKNIARREAEAAAQAEIEARKAAEKAAAMCGNTTTTIDHAPCVLDKGHRNGENATGCRSAFGKKQIEDGLREIVAMVFA
jgi:hypothetical protein